MAQAAPSSWPIIDFHAHIRPPWWRFEAPSYSNPADTAWARQWGAKFTAPDVLLEESRAGDVSLRLLSSTIEGIFGIDGPTDPVEIARHNDYLAELSGKYPGQLAALAVVDAYSGENAAREVERAVTQLGHVGVVIDSARGELFPNAAAARPTLEAAAALKVPVLVHPVASPNAHRLIAAAGRPGNSFGRGHVNGTAFLALLESGVLGDLPDLHVVFTGIGIGALAIAASDLPQYRGLAAGNAAPRPNAYFDFMGLSPAVLRFAMDVLGVERVVVGSDWPIWDNVTRANLVSAFDAAGIAEADRVLIAGGNAARLIRHRSR